MSVWCVAWMLIGFALGMLTQYGVMSRARDYKYPAGFRRPHWTERDFWFDERGR